MEIISSDTEGNTKVNEVQVLNNIISLNHRPITILVPNNQTIKTESNPSPQSQKIPRPANAFMVYANENRKKVAKEHPQESNKEISCRLGLQWKRLTRTEKDKYFDMAKALDADHKKKYPDYVYNPKEARIRKAMRERERTIGAAQMGSQRSRRPNWPKIPNHMQGNGPANHPEHLLGNPPKDLCTALRAEMEHGFLAGNGGYVYPAQQYQFSPQSDYAAYIQVAPGLSNWVQNQYNIQQQEIAQHHVWNQYQTERLRAQQTAGSPYLINSQTDPPQYHPVDHIPQNMLQMGPTPSMKPTIHQNLQNATCEVERYMNLPNTITSTPQSSTPEVRTIRTPISDNIRKTPAISSPAPAETAAVETPQDVTPPELNLSSVTSMSEIDAQINNSGGTSIVSSSPNTSFGGIHLFDEGVNIVADMHKELNQRKNVKPTPQNNPNIRKPEIREPHHPVFPIKFIPNRSQPQFIRQNNYVVDNFVSELHNTYSEPGNVIFNRTEFPTDFSAQKYYESVANGDFDGPILSGDSFGNYIFDEGCTFIPFSNPPEMTNPCIFTPSQFEAAQLLNDSIEARLVSNDNNLILDLSKMPQNEENIDVGVEKSDSEKLTEVSNKICDELSKMR